MTQELYKRYRPKSLRQVMGSPETVATLRNMVKRSTVPHTILFHGPSGCGKTTMARILRRKLGCNDLDFVELDCSAFRGIDTIRDIMRQMKLSPTGGDCRVWLLDEVHQLSRDAQHGALKMLEDTPGHVYFFLCTTDPGKLLKTIRTRCCELPVRELRADELESLVRRVQSREEIEISEDALQDLIDFAGGSARTCLVLLDKIANLPPDEQAEALAVKAEEENEAIELCRALIQRASWPEVAKILKGLQGEPESIRWAVLGYARAVLLNKRNDQAYNVICAFESHFYDSKQAGLTRACYEAIFGEPDG